MTPTGRTRRNEAKREAILDAAARLFNQQGLKGATLSDVARGVGLVTNSVTYYFRRKEDLAAACLLRAIDAVDAVCAAAARRHGRAERVDAFVRGYVGMLADIESGRRSELVRFHDVRALTEPQRGRVFEAYGSMYRGIRGLVAVEGASRPQRRAHSALAHLLLSVVFFTRAWIRRYEPADYPRVAGCLSDLLLGGMGGAAAWSSLTRWSVASDGADGDDAPDGAAADAGASADAFLRAATILVNEQGYRGASVERISALLNVTKGSFYHHHEHKDDLIAACFARTFDVIRGAQDRAAAGTGTGWQRLGGLCCALVGHQVSAAGPLLRFTARSALPEHLRRDTSRTLARLAERFGHVVVDGMVDGSIRPMDPSIAAQVVAGMIDAATELPLWVPGVDADEAAMLYVKPLFDGLRASFAARRPASA
ncbi:MAG TPA: TetR/AcrR family transcriptional regulator [Quisquiliibacterium sp.]|nr:TetR/AcrR family transcriptional regulator [Quisquiliibacterium sp.]